ncbi:MAG: hypothetical protein QOD07_2107 [Frankiaceae bacterium]|jgi:hypothetical protein|nr:hypothetical protein [Frankiaceae bacterium]
MTGAERRTWGPYLAERAWGTVREDYSADGDAWAYLPFDHARSRAFRWSEDGLAGWSDAAQRLCLAFAFWNGRDPILKERVFGLSNAEGNHGEDAKDYWWYLDATPDASWLRWRYHYPQAPFPYDELRAENARRGRDQGEYELLDTGVFDGDRYWAITVDYAKAAADDACVRVTVENRGPDAATLHVLPTLWFRNTWAWEPGSPQPVIRSDGARLVAEHDEMAPHVLTGDGDPVALMCDNETNARLLYGTKRNASRYPKDGIGDHVVAGRPTVNPMGVGTKGALHYALGVPAGGSATIRLRLSARSTVPNLKADWARVMNVREREADVFHAALLPPGTTADDAAIARQAFAGMVWGKQFFHYDVDRWLAGDPGQPTPPPQRRHGRNAAWHHLNNHDVVSMPDPWEYPWYAAWDLAFHCVTFAHIDAEFAKDQLVLLCREWYMHPSGQLPAYEWDFGDANPPVHAWAAMRVFEIDGSRDYEFLEKVFHKLLINFTWWVNRKDSEGNNIFEGGFLGLDNIGPFDRSQLPVAGHLEQSDATSWMARYCLDMLEMALTLARHDKTYVDVATKFFEHFAYVSQAIVDQGLWDDDDGFFYDLLHTPDDQRVPLRVRSMVGLLPLCAVLAIDEDTLRALPEFEERMHWFLHNKPQWCRGLEFAHVPDGGNDRRLLSVVDPQQLRRILHRVFDETEFLSPHGLRSLSQAHRDAPVDIAVDGYRGRVDYEPGESRTGLFGGNSNWRGPVWFPLNYLLVWSLRRFDHYLGDGFTVEVPTGSGRTMTLRAAADEVASRLVDLFRLDADGRRPVWGDASYVQSDPRWRDQLPFHEYFHGDTGAGLGASHQTGWTGLVANLVVER